MHFSSGSFLSCRRLLTVGGCLLLSVVGSWLLFTLFDIHVLRSSWPLPFDFGGLWTAVFDTSFGLAFAGGLWVLLRRRLPALAFCVLPLIPLLWLTGCSLILSLFGYGYETYPMTGFQMLVVSVGLLLSFLTARLAVVPVLFVILCMVVRPMLLLPLPAVVVVAFGAVAFILMGRRLRKHPMFCPHASDPFVASAFACISVLLLILGLYGLAGHCALCRHRAPMYRLPCLVQRDGGNRVELLPHVRGIFPGPAAGASIYWDADFFRAPYCSLGHGPYPSVRPQEPRAKDAKNLRNPDGSVLSPLAVYWKPDADGILRLTRIEAPGTSADKRREGETRTLLHMTAFAETDILSSVRGDNNCRLVLDAVLFDVKTVLPFRDGPFTRTWPGITMEQMLGIKPTPFGLDVRLTPGAVPEPGTLWYGTRNLDADPVLSEPEASPAPVRR